MLTGGLRLWLEWSMPEQSWRHFPLQNLDPHPPCARRNRSDRDGFLQAISVLFCTSHKDYDHSTSNLRNNKNDTFCELQSPHRHELDALA